MKRKLQFLLLFHFLFMTSFAFAQNTNVTQHEIEQLNVPNVLIDHPERESDTFQRKFFNMLFVLALLIAFMILASWALKRMMKTKLTATSTTNQIRVLEARYLSPRATLYLVEIQDRAILIAESPTSVTCLATMPLENEPHTPE